MVSVCDVVRSVVPRAVRNVLLCYSWLIVVMTLCMVVWGLIGISRLGGTTLFRVLILAETGT